MWRSREQSIVSRGLPYIQDILKIFDFLTLLSLSAFGTDLNYTLHATSYICFSLIPFPSDVDIIYECPSVPLLTQRSSQLSGDPNETEPFKCIRGPSDAAAAPGRPAGNDALPAAARRSLGRSLLLGLRHGRHGSRTIGAFFRDRATSVQ